MYGYYSILQHNKMCHVSYNFMVFWGSSYKSNFLPVQRPENPDLHCSRECMQATDNGLKPFHQFGFVVSEVVEFFGLYLGYSKDLIGWIAVMDPGGERVVAEVVPRRISILNQGGIEGVFKVGRSRRCIMSWGRRIMVEALNLGSRIINAHRYYVTEIGRREVPQCTTTALIAGKRHQ